MRQIREIILHSSASTFGDAATIDGWHKQRGWSGIGYHYVILNGTIKGGKYNPDHDGMVQYGREIERMGAHVKGHNAHSIGICIIGKRRFSGPQLQSLQKLLRELMDRYGLTPDDIRCHYQYDKRKPCPNLDASLVHALVR